ncbi:GntR family transcriptional regulator [Streptomyces sp. NPDC057654]|uniref:GntR family transcriptional regulator n=1 Tax=Streptomyces sp. NPDC057654 TaxID=3346196 RepID=UPI0036D06292
MLPTVRTLGAMFHASEPACRHALHVLADEGIVIVRTGKGSVVQTPNQPPSPLDSAPGLREFIVHELRQAIRDGSYPPGSAVPSAARLAIRYGVSEATARNAQRQLREEGLLEGGRGQRARVCSLQDAATAATDITWAPPEAQRLAAEVCQAIKDGTYRPGSLLPSQKRLARTYGASLHSARIAHRLLVQLGVTDPPTLNGARIRTP